MSATSFLGLATALILWEITLGSYLLNAAPKCQYKELPCDSGQCVDRTSWCDGPADCYDDSDEKYCRTFNPNDADESPSNINNCAQSKYFQCQNGMCIPKAGRCNDMPDCQEGEDEENCDYLYESEDSSESVSFSTTEEISTTVSTTPEIITSTTTARPTTTSTTTAATTTTAKYVQSFSRGDVSWIPSRFDVLQKSVRHMIEERDVTWGWGKATPRIATALYLANSSYFDLDNYDGLLTKKQLEVQLALDLMKNIEKPLRMHELVHYIHALLVTCTDPRDFHGVNLVKLLKRTMAKRQTRGLFINPIAYLALCNVGDFSDAYDRKLKNMAYRRNDEPRWLDVQTYALLTISCRSMRNGSDSKEWMLLKKDVARNISEWQQADGGFGTIHSTGLTLQALIAAEEPGTEVTKGRAMTHLLMKQDWQGSYGNELDNYYVLPALNMRSLASIHTRKCKPQTYNTQNTEGVRDPHEERKKRQMYVHYSLWIGGEKNEIQTVSLGLPRHSDFLQVMDAAEKLNPHFKHELLSTGRSTSVHSIAGRSSDLEKSTYWTLYRKVPVPFRPKLSNVTATVSRLKLLGAKRWTKDLRKLHPRDGEHLAFWYKPYL